MIRILGVGDGRRGNVRIEGMCLVRVRFVMMVLPIQWLPMEIRVGFFYIIGIRDVKGPEFRGSNEFICGRDVGGFDLVGCNVSAQISLPILRRA